MVAAIIDCGKRKTYRINPFQLLKEFQKVEMKMRFASVRDEDIDFGEPIILFDTYLAVKTGPETYEVYPDITDATAELIAKSFYASLSMYEFMELLRIISPHKELIINSDRVAMIEPWDLRTLSHELLLQVSYEDKNDLNDRSSSFSWTPKGRKRTKQWESPYFYRNL